MIEHRKEVDELIVAYVKYKQLMSDEAAMSTTLAKQKILGVVDEEVRNKRTTLRRELQDLSDSMTFSHPFVWILYKFEAYKNEAQPILTMRDFRLHCSKQGDICAKRFAFVNERLFSKGHPTLLAVEFYDDAKLLGELIDEPSLIDTVGDPEFMRLWKIHEYNMDGGRVAKWESYSTAEYTRK